MDDYNSQSASYTIAILPIKNDIYGVYNDSINLLANELSNQLRNIPGVQTLNIPNSLRKLTPGNYQRHFTSIKKDFNNSEFPDPNDLSVVAQALNADKIILVSGGLNTENGMLRKQLLAYDAIWVVPKYEYTAFINMFDPITGDLEWQQTFQTKIPFKNALIPSVHISSNPLLDKDFRNFSKNISLKASESLQKYFYTTETSTVKVKLLDKKSTATDGDLTTDGQPLSSASTNNYANQENTNNSPKEEKLNTTPKNESSLEQTAPIQQEDENISTNTEAKNTVNKKLKNKPYLDIKDLKPEYEQELLEEYQNKMKSKY